MEDLDHKLSQLLSSPEDMAKIMDLARQLSGEPVSPAPSSGQEDGEQPDPELLKTVTRLFREYRSGDGGKTALAEALSPYLEQERREQLRKAVQLARLARTAKAFLGELGGGEKHL